MAHRADGPAAACPGHDPDAVNGRLPPYTLRLAVSGSAAPPLPPNEVMVEPKPEAAASPEHGGQWPRATPTLHNRRGSRMAALLSRFRTKRDRCGKVLRRPELRSRRPANSAESAAPLDRRTARGRARACWSTRPSNLAASAPSGQKTGTPEICLQLDHHVTFKFRSGSRLLGSSIIKIASPQVRPGQYIRVYAAPGRNLGP